MIIITRQPGVSDREYDRSMRHLAGLVMAAGVLLMAVHSLWTNTLLPLLAGLNMGTSTPYGVGGMLVAVGLVMLWNHTDMFEGAVGQCVQPDD